MRLALFAANRVGKEIASILAAKGVLPVCLVLDRADPGGHNAGILSAFAPGPERVFWHEALIGASGESAFAACSPDLGLLAWWPRILEERLLKVPSLGVLNLHPSLLPFGRGKHPNFWALVEGTPFGVSIHFAEREIDSGDVAFQATLETSWEDTGESLYLRACERIVQLFRENLDSILAGAIPRAPQAPGHGPARRAREIDEASRIALDDPASARKVLNLVRARTYPPYPAAWFEDGGFQYEVRVTIRRRDPGETGT